MKPHEDFHVQDTLLEKIKGLQNIITAMGESTGINRTEQWIIQKLYFC
jgi:hypothetical protein